MQSDNKAFAKRRNAGSECVEKKVSFDCLTNRHIR